MKPGKIDNSKIIESVYKTLTGDFVSTELPEQSHSHIHLNYQLKRGLKEGQDFMLVDENIYNIWKSKYGEDIQLKRFGIVDESGETVVELYFKKINILPIPNQKLFKLYKGKDIQTECVYLSRNATMDELSKKVCRILSTYLYIVVKNKHVLIKEVRMWKSNEDLHKLKDLD